MNIFSDFKNNMRARKMIASGEIYKHVPGRQVEQYPGGQQKIRPQLKDALAKVASLLAQNEFELISKIVEDSYQSGAQVCKGCYEYELLITPLEHYADQSDDDPIAGERAAASLLDWYQSQPDNPYAAALSAISMHNVGFGWRGTDWAHKVTREGWEKLHSATDAAVQLLEESASLHSSHWFWREIRLHMCISDYQSPEDHAERFELALESQPNSKRTWGIFAYQLLPRWYGSFEQLHDLALRGYREHPGDIGVEIYHEIFSTVFDAEQSMEVMFRDPEIQRVIADKYSGSTLDVDLTVAASLYYDLGEHQKALGCLKRINIFYLDHWYCDDSLEWMAAKSLH